ncbi:MAG: ABC transporter permease subunit, partial [Vallitaleaceae bacterium]|nr:ABC transporter permease subunit [Vallitaleaceae bacterium]
MNIYLQELRAYRKSLIIWCVSLVAILSLYLSLFPAISADADSYIKVLEGYPESIRVALGMNIATMTSSLGFFAFTLTFMVFFGAIQAMNIGLSIVSKEVRERTADFLMTKPISRTQMMTSKVLAAFSLILITNAVYLITSSLLLNSVSDEGFDGSTFIMMALTFSFVQIMCLAIGLLVSVALAKIKSVLPISMGLTFAFFAVGSFIATEQDDPLRYFTPFR